MSCYDCSTILTFNPLSPVPSSLWSSWRVWVRVSGKVGKGSLLRCRGPRLPPWHSAQWPPCVPTCWAGAGGVHTGSLCRSLASRRGSPVAGPSTAGVCRAFHLHSLWGCYSPLGGTGGERAALRPPPQPHAVPLWARLG